jgi:hypothetical protein
MSDFDSVEHFYWMLLLRSIAESVPEPCLWNDWIVRSLGSH